MENKVLYWKLQNRLESPEIKPGTKEYEIYRDHYKVNYESRELMNEVQTIMHHRINGWKHPLFSQIHSLTIAYVHDNTVRVKYITGQEKDLLQTFLNTVKSEHFKEYKIAHFEADVLLPYLGIRLDKNKNKQTLPQDLQYKNTRPWNLTGISIRDFYQGAGVYKPTLKELAYIFDVETDFVDPADEFTLLQAGKTEELKQSAVDEIFALVNVHRLMLGEDVIEDLKIAEERVENVQEVVEIHPLEELCNSKEFTPAIKKRLESLMKRKKPTKKDKEQVFEIMRGVWVQNDFVNGRQDSKAEVERKEKEIKEFITQLYGE